LTIPTEPDIPTSCRTNEAFSGNGASAASRAACGPIRPARSGQERIGKVHDVHELFMVVAGQVELALGSAVLRPAVGEEVLIPAGMRHTVRNVGTGPARWLYAYRVVS
jgi:mannose-6-phosphate isomerase-like protein (cupin superfamily)